MDARHYRWLKHRESRRERSARELTAQIRQIHEQSHKRYGSPRVFHELRRQGVKTSENRVARLMQAAGLKARPKRAFRPRTTDSNHPNPIAPNRLKEAQESTAPDQIWVADITYIWTLEGWIYLAAAWTCSVGASSAGL